MMNRRTFIQKSGALTLGAALATPIASAANNPVPLKISLAQWTINKELFSGKIDNLDFAKVAAEHGIHAVEYVNQFFMDRTTDIAYMREMKTRAGDLGVKSLLIMCDAEGNIGDPDGRLRSQAIENHRKWIDAAVLLGCHSIRVNAYSEGTWDEQAKLVADGLARLTAIGEDHGINVIVENHGGYSSHPDWLLAVMKKVDHPMCGTLPDFGNFRIDDSTSYDSYEGTRKLMPWAKGVSVKDRVWNHHHNRSDLDYTRMLKIVLNSGFEGYCGIEHGGYEGLNAARRSLEKAFAALA